MIARRKFHHRVNIDGSNSFAQTQSKCFGKFIIPSSITFTASYYTVHVRSTMCMDIKHETHIGVLSAEIFRNLAASI